MKRKLNVLFLTIAIILTAILLAIGFKNGTLKVYCPFNLITGFLCPGCGNTRATLSLLRFDFNSVFKYNLMYFLEIFYCLWLYANVCINYIKEGRFFYGRKWIKFDVAILIIIILWGMFRNII